MGPLMFDSNFEGKKNNKKAWKSFQQVAIAFLSYMKDENYKLFVQYSFGKLFCFLGDHFL